MNLFITIYVVICMLYIIIAFACHFKQYPLNKRQESKPKVNPVKQPSPADEELE